MEFGLKGTSRVSRGRHGEVGIVEFGLDDTSVSAAARRESSMIASRAASTNDRPATTSVMSSSSSRPTIVSGRRRGWSLNAHLILVIYRRRRAVDYEHLAVTSS